MRSSYRRALRCARRSVREDSGFSLIEAVVALVVATIAFTALAAAGLAAIRGSLDGRANQQAADFMTREIETRRLLDFGSLANVTADLAGDPDVGNCSGKPCIDPGTGVKEQIYVGSGTGGAVNPHVKTLQDTTSNQTKYTIKTYVTIPAGAGNVEYRRVTVVVSWKIMGRSHVRRTSTMISPAQVGLPLPVFKLTPQGGTTVSVNPGANVVYGFRVSNQGAPDRFELTENDSYTWDWFVDVDQNGSFDPTVDTTPVSDSDGNGVLDTGRLNPNESLTFFVVHDTSGETSHTTTTTWQAKSVAQPSAATGTQTAITTTNVVTGVVTPTPTPSSTPSTPPAADCNTASPNPVPAAASGYSNVTYTLHNAATPANTTAGALLTMDKNAPYATTLYEYSTDVVSGQPGRVITPGGSFSGGSTAQVVDWRYPVGKKAYAGTPVVTLWGARLVSGSATDIKLTAFLYKYTKGTGNSFTATQVAAIDLEATPLTCSGFQKLVGAPASAIAVPQLGQNDQFGVRVVNTGTSNVRIAYDVQAVYPATVVLPEK